MSLKDSSCLATHHLPLLQDGTSGLLTRDCPPVMLVNPREECRTRGDLGEEGKQAPGGGKFPQLVLLGLSLCSSQNTPFIH